LQNFKLLLLFVIIISKRHTIPK